MNRIVQLGIGRLPKKVQFRDSKSFSLLLEIQQYTRNTAFKTLLKAMRCNDIETNLTTEIVISFFSLSLGLRTKEVMATRTEDSVENRLFPPALLFSECGFKFCP